MSTRALPPPRRVGPQRRPQRRAGARSRATASPSRASNRRTRPAPRCASTASPACSAARCGGRGKPRRRSATRSASTPEEIDYAGELTSGETFEQAIERVRRLKAELEAGAAGRAAAARHPRHLHPLLPPRLGPRRALRAPTMAAGIWNLGSHNCGLSVFAHGESRDPLGQPSPRLDLPHLDGAAVESARDDPHRVVGRDLPLLVDDRPRRRRHRPVQQRVVGLAHPGVEPLAHLRQHLGLGPGPRRRCCPPAGRAPGRRAAPRGPSARPSPPRPAGPCVSLSSQLASTGCG